jgi:curved DNA-binding protein
MAATDFKDYYQILGVNKSTSTDEIKKKFRKLALKYHPDRNPGDKVAEAKFKEISEAYEVLGDEDKRKKYDQFGQYWKQAEASSSPWGNSGGVNQDFGGFDFSQYGNFEEFINELLGKFSTGGATSDRSATTNPFQRGTTSYSSNIPSQEAPITLTFTEAFKGTEKKLSLGNETITVRIPPGAKNGTRIRIKGKGEIDPYTRQRGDIYLNVNLSPHNFFKFDGDKLTCEVPITPAEAVLGLEIDVPTPDGMVTMKIPPGIKSGQSLRLKGKGWPHPKQNRGDQLVKIAIEVPKRPSAEEQELYQKILVLNHQQPRIHLNKIRL